MAKNNGEGPSTEQSRGPQRAMNKNSLPESRNFLHGQSRGLWDAQLVSIRPMNRGLLCLPFFFFLNESFNYLIHLDPPWSTSATSGPEYKDWTSAKNLEVQLAIARGWNFWVVSQGKGEIVFRVLFGERMRVRRMHTQTTQPELQAVGKETCGPPILTHPLFLGTY